MKEILKLPGSWLSKFIAILISLIFFTVFIGVSIYQYRLEYLLKSIEYEHGEILNESVASINRTLGDMKNSINLLYHDPSLSKVWDDKLSINHGRVAEIFKLYAMSIAPLFQVRWINEKGREKVRVDKKNNIVNVMQEAFLQSKYNRYYFKKTIEKPYPSIYFSNVDLNVENDIVQYPYQPNIRVGIRTGDKDNMAKGALILNFNLEQLLTKLRNKNKENIYIEIVDSKGFWLLNNDRGKEWGGSLGFYNHNIATTDKKIWQLLQENGLHTVIIDGKLISFRKTNLSDDNNNHDSQFLYLIVITPEKVINNITWESLWPSLILSTLIFIISSVLLWRDIKYQTQLYTLNRDLNLEKKELENINFRVTGLLEQQHKLQEDLIKSEKLSALGMMVAGVAHELNTPIGAALMAVSKQRGNHELLTKAFANGLTQADLEQYLIDNIIGIELIETNLQRSAELVRSFKRLAIDRAQDDLVTFELRQVIDDLIKSLFHKVKYRKVKIVLEIEQDLILHSYPGVLSQIFQNLIVNALDHAFKPEIGGEIIIMACKVDTIHVEIKVTDDGFGIKPIMLSNIFEPFVTSKRATGNTGLGLHFVHQWVTKSLKGKLKVTSELNKGTQFIITIPLDLTPNLPSD